MIARLATVCALLQPVVFGHYGADQVEVCQNVVAAHDAECAKTCEVFAAEPPQLCKFVSSLVSCVSWIHPECSPPGAAIDEESLAECKQGMTTSECKQYCDVFASGFWFQECAKINTFSVASCLMKRYPQCRATFRTARASGPSARSCVPPPPPGTPAPVVNPAPGNTPPPAPPAGGGGSVIPASGPVEKKRICYHTNWSKYRPSEDMMFPGVFDNVEIESLDPFMCTHIHYGFAYLCPAPGLNTGEVCQRKFQIVQSDSWADTQDSNSVTIGWGTGGQIHSYLKLRQANPNLKLIFSLGGWNYNDCNFNGDQRQGPLSCGTFSEIASTQANRELFAQEVVAFVEKYTFDGIDIDWEYPVIAQHNVPHDPTATTPQDKANYIEMLRVLSETLKPKGLLLSAAVGVGPDPTMNSYDIPAMAKYLDHIGLMTYDFHGGFDTKGGCNAPLFATSEDYANWGPYWSTDEAVQHWKAQVPDYATKLFMGLPAYGRSQKLVNGGKFLADTNGGGEAGKYTQEPGYLSYYEVMEKLPSATESGYDSERVCAWMVSNGEFITYDSTEVIAKKLDYVVQQGLAGVMWWAIDLDDVSKCYPLVSQARAKFCPSCPQIKC